MGGDRTGKVACVEKAQGYAASPPCWLLQGISHGVRVEGVKHSGANGWLKARNALLHEAMVELSLAKYGADIDLASLVTRDVRDSGGAVQKNLRVVKQAVFTYGGEKIHIKAHIEDYYYAPRVEKIYLWVMEDD